MNEALLISFVGQLAKDIELTDIPVVDANKTYKFSFGKDLAIGIRAMETGFYLTSYLGPCSEQNCEDFFSTLMHANLFGKGTGGGIIGLNEEGKQFTFTKKYPFQMNYAEFKSHIEDFINYVDLWQKKVNDQLVKV
ncbi:MAG: type III secretion system chaperone [Chlamydiales bacterium]|nr:type III secretion system chaperone [Chlamydiales bacterium]